MQSFKRTGMSLSFVSLFLEKGRTIKMKKRKFSGGGVWGEKQTVGWTEMDCFSNVCGRM
jgi:hypothetical protein